MGNYWPLSLMFIPDKWVETNISQSTQDSSIFYRGFFFLSHWKKVKKLFQESEPSILLCDKFSRRKKGEKETGLAFMFANIWKAKEKTYDQSGGIRKGQALKY